MKRDIKPEVTSIHNQLEQLKFELNKYKNYWQQSMNNYDVVYKQLTTLLKLIHSARHETNTTIKAKKVAEMESHLKFLLKRYDFTR